MENISITVPMKRNALVRAGEMLLSMADDIKDGPKTVEPLVEAAKKMGKLTPPDVAPAPEVVAETPAPTPEPDAAEVFAAPTPEAVAETPAPTTGTDLDKNGLPWDGRIHASTKTKLVTGEWKNKRGIDKDLLASVEAELKEVMAIPTTEVATPAPVVVAETPTPTPTPAAPGSITTFPELMTAITANSLSPEVVTGVVKAVGLQSLPLLAARTDLIPKVVERLGL